MEGRYNEWGGLCCKLVAACGSAAAQRMYVYIYITWQRNAPVVCGAITRILTKYIYDVLESSDLSPRTCAWSPIATTANQFVLLQ